MPGAICRHPECRPVDIKGVQMMLGDLFFMERIYRHRITDAVFGKGYGDACLEDRKSVKDLW